MTPQMLADFLRISTVYLGTPDVLSANIYSKIVGYIARDFIVALSLWIGALKIASLITAGIDPDRPRA